MPQTREHLAILDLLEVAHGVVALTKRDLVDDEGAALAREDADRGAGRDRGWQAAEIIEVSARTGAGAGRPARGAAAGGRYVPRRAHVGPHAGCPVDRVFSLRGIGTVVTGTLWGGSIAAGDRVTLLPQGVEGRVRSLQTHDRDVSEAADGGRVAACLVGVERGDIAARHDPGGRAAAADVVPPGRRAAFLPGRGQGHDLVEAAARQAGEAEVQDPALSTGTAVGSAHADPTARKTLKASASRPRCLVSHNRRVRSNDPPRYGRGPMGPDLVLALELADTADAIALARFRATDLVVQTKPDRTPVTEADLAVETAIREVLARAHPRDAILGEEHGETGAGERRWIVDPIDGTRNYSRGVPVWATLIALEEGGEVQLGVVSAPALGRRWYAERGGGAWAGDDRVRVSSVRRVEDAVLTFALEQPLPALAAQAWHARGYGDFWSHMLVAEGAVDGAIDAIGVSLWDLAAVQVMVEEAGGTFTDFHGARRLDGGSAITSNGHLHPALLAAVALPDRGGRDDGGLVDRIA